MVTQDEVGLLGLGAGELLFDPLAGAFYFNSLRAGICTVPRVAQLFTAMPTAELFGTLVLAGSKLFFTLLIRQS